jgi:hypothetical protein|tara:strand:- start:761 stop:1480 length:720 start_codon:yes stop_codon:yes gene_type:complete
MPRKIDEAWGDDGFHEFKSVKFKTEDLTRWFEMLGSLKVPINRDHLRLRLTDIGVSLRCGHQRGARSFNIRQATKALETLLEQSTVNAGLVSRLNGRAEQALHDQLLMMDLPIFADGLGVVEGLEAGLFDEKTLRDAARRAIDQLNTPPKDRFGNPGKKISRERDATLPWAVEELCKLWEQLTGEPVTSWNEEGAEYSSHATSKSGIWITEIIIKLTNKHSRSRTRLAIQDFVRKRKNA